jgi:3-oxoacyl-[acyl-carrier-protein] synthase II
MLGAAGAVELAFCCKALETGVVPPTLNLDNPDPECDLDYVAHTSRELKVDAILNNSFGFGGHNSTTALKRFVG